MTKEAFDRVMEHHNMLIIVPRDVSEAFEFVSDCIDEEIERIKKEEPYATTAMSKLEDVLQEIFLVKCDVEEAYENFEVKGEVNCD